MEKSKMNIEIERKYIIEKPNAEAMSQNPDYSKSQIEQIYLKSEPNITRRIRKRDYGEKTVFKETEKIRIDGMSAIEKEKELTENEYMSLKSQKKDGTSILYKERHTFLYCGQLFEIDIYPEWENTCIMETELKDRKTQVKMPDFIKIIEEVTGNKIYTNASMSQKFPKEKEISRITEGLS